MIWFCVMLGSTAQLSLKHGLNTVGRFEPNPGEPAGFAAQFIGFLMRAFQNPFVVAGFALYGIASLAWLIVVSRVPLSLAYPMIALTYVVVVIMSRVLFHEDVTALRYASLAVICAGVFMLSRS
jgi:drug/metabolite transporter (DMT)-like permease